MDCETGANSCQRRKEMARGNESHKMRGLGGLAGPLLALRAGVLKLRAAAGASPKKTRVRKRIFVRRGARIRSQAATAYNQWANPLNRQRRVHSCWRDITT